MIGVRIRKLRLDTGLSQSELARRAGVSKSLLSQIERGKANPSIDSVHAIAAALEVPLFSIFLEEDKLRSALVRRDQRTRLVVPNSDSTRELLSPDLQGEMVLLLSRIRPCGSSSRRPASHKGEECVFVLRGTLSVVLGEETYDLEAGDALYFDARLPHLFRNDSEAELEFLCAISSGGLLSRQTSEVGR